MRKIIYLKTQMRIVLRGQNAIYHNIKMAVDGYEKEQILESAQSDDKLALVCGPTHLCFFLSPLFVLGPTKPLVTDGTPLNPTNAVYTSTTFRVGE